MAEANELIELITLGQSISDLKGADPSKIPEIVAKWIDLAEEKQKKTLPTVLNVQRVLKSRIVITSTG